MRRLWPTGGCRVKNKETQVKLTIILNYLQHVSTHKSHLQAQYKAVYIIIQCHKMDEIYVYKVYS
jgi:hypothetical protein